MRNTASSAAKATSRNSINGSRSQLQDENETETETHDLFGLDIEIDEDAEDEDEDEEEYFYCLDDPVDSQERTAPLIIYDADTGALPASTTNAARRNTTSTTQSKSTTTRSSASGQRPGQSDFCIQPGHYPEPPQQERPHHPDKLMMFVSNERNILEYTANEL